MQDKRKLHFNQEGGGMLIGSASSLSSTAAVFDPVLASRASAGPSSATTEAAAAAQTQSIADPSVDLTSGTSTPGRTTSEAASEAGHSAAAEVQVTSYSMSVAGNQYWGSVEQTGGEYMASVPFPAGASATGLSQQQAEDNLETRVDELV
jgi:hypothetical protein